MANGSDASGTLYFKGDWDIEDKLNFLYVVKLLEYGNYNTVLMDDFEKIYTDVRKGIPITQLSFNGEGRWTFSNNLEDFERWTKPSYERWQSLSGVFSLQYKISFAEFQKRRTYLLEAMRMKQLTIIWDFRDFEGGHDLLYDEQGVLSAVHKLDEEEKKYILKFDYKINNVTTYECNLKNYVDLIELGELERVGETAQKLAHLFNIIDMNYVFDLILLDNTYYDLPIYMYEPTLESVPFRLSLVLQDVYQEQQLNIKINSI